MATDDIALILSLSLSLSPPPHGTALLFSSSPIHPSSSIQPAARARGSESEAITVTIVPTLPAVSAVKHGLATDRDELDKFYQIRLSVATLLDGSGCRR